MAQAIRKVNSPTDRRLINNYKFRPASFKFNYTSLQKTRQISFWTALGICKVLYKYYYYHQAAEEVS